MKKYVPIYLYGAMIVLEGLFLLFSRDNSFGFVRTATGVILSLAALLAYYAAFSRRRNHVQFAYHELHALAMLVYGVAILTFCNSVESMRSFTIFLFIFYSISEITFCNWLFNLSRKIAYKIIFVRLFLGLLIGVGTIVAMNDTTYKWEGFGLPFILVGTNVLLYSPAMRGNDLPENLTPSKISEL